MRIVTFNANGIRAAERKGFFRWFARQRADVLCVQELKAQAAQIDNLAFHVRGFHRYLFPARKPGYSGVALYCREEPEEVVCGYGDAEFDDEGRHIEARFRSCIVTSTYFPSGSSGEERQAAKFRFLDGFEQRMHALLEDSLPGVVCGDVNIAHKVIDIKNWRSNQKNSGFTPEERAWMDHIIDDVGFVDAFRTVNAQPDQYTWWSNRGRARENNVGWRIDYHLVTPELAKAATKVRVYKDRFFSDHAPLIIDYDI
ncbi:MAG: exodeoxyribonuclease III [Gammaproteobacteria bacterium]